MSPPITRALLEQLPKAELHCHLDGSLRPSTMLDLAREYKVVMPRDDADALGDFMLVRDAANLEDYLTRFDTTLSVMQTADSLDRVAYELAEDAAREGVRYLEVRFAPILNIRGGLSLGEAVEAPLRGLARAERDHGIVARVLVCSLRHLPPDTSMELARLAVAYKSHGVVGFDLAGGEAGYPASAHADAFAYAHAHDLACTCHAGEGDGADSVRQAVYGCCAQRIGHATRLIEDASLTDYVNDQRIALEICLTSNVQTRAASSYEAHPLRQYFDRGLNVVLNTDNRLMSGVNLVDEYLHAARELDFTFDELARMAINGFESAFIPLAERQLMIDSAHRDIEVLRNG
ncbi:MAG: adenosine deaminase [Gemmatimonadaceae bacterium]|nr:adenosine deaminase [Gemmatimonadaceae bacterium]